MRKIAHFLILFGLIAVFVIVFVVSTDHKVEPVEVEVTLAHDKGWLPTFQENFTRQGEKARAETGVGFKSIPSMTTELYIHQMKATLPTKQAPDLFTWWSTFRVKELIDQNLVGDLTRIWDRHRDEYPRGIQNAFSVNGRMYGFPYGVDYWPVWYNKKIFKRLGLEEPESWQDFLNICDTLKAAGITPILSSVQYKWPSLIWFEEMIIGEDPDLYEDLCLGKVKYTHPAVKKAFDIWREMINKGYFSEPSANMMSNGGYLWKTEAQAMVLCGTWYLDNVLFSQGADPESVGVFVLPSHNPKSGKNIVFEVAPVFTAGNAENVEAAEKIADWWMGKEGNGYFAGIHKAYPGNIKVNTDYLPPIKAKLIAGIKQEKYRVLNRYWEATPAEIGTFAVEKFGEFMLNPDRLDMILMDIQEVADQYWSKHN